MKQSTQMYQETIRIVTRDADHNGRWRPDAMFQAMQEVSGNHCLQLGVGFDVLFPAGMAWVLNRIRVSVRRRPAIGEYITILTWPAPIMRWFYPRGFRAVDERGETVVEASTLWAVLDRHERKMVVPAATGLIVPESDEPLPFPPTASARIPEGEAEVVDYAPTYSDLDVNGHVNNTRYIAWLCDRLGVRTLTDHSIGDLTINYNKEVRADEPIRLSLVRAGESFGLSGMVNGAAHFAVSGTLVPMDAPPQAE